MRVRLLVGAVLFAAVVLGLLIGFAGSVPGPVAASGGLASGVAVPNATNTPRPTPVPSVRLYRFFRPSQTWSTPAIAWADIKSLIKLADPDTNTHIELSMFIRGKGYARMEIENAADVVTPTFYLDFESPATSVDRVYITDVHLYNDN